MKMNSISGILKRADANISIAEQSLEAKDFYGAGEVYDELSSIINDLRVQKMFLDIFPGQDQEDLNSLNEKMLQIKSVQVKINEMINQLEEDLTIKSLFGGE